MKLLTRLISVSAIGTFALGCAAWAQTAPPPDTYTPRVGQEGKDVVWVPTADSLVARMLDMAELQPGDRLVDLGSGDGRTVIAAARRGIPSRGIEYNADLVVLSQQNAEAAGVADLARFEQGDIFESDFSDATVVTLFLLPALNLRLRPILLDMPPGTRIVSNSFHMDEWQSDERVTVEGECSTWCRAYKWVVPAKVGGAWKLGSGELKLTQTFQMLEGTLDAAGQTVEIADARMDGTQIRFAIGERLYTGEVGGNTMRGTIDGKTPWSATRVAQDAR
jgi:hypothetical protein